ncbi:MAG: hypothetical protein ABRQ27_13505 [Clostridiaceae bacterium]
MIYAINAIPDDWKKVILGSLKEGTGRFGCRYDTRQDLLTDDYIEDKNKCKFLESIKESDYVIYINVPQHGMCTMAKVKSGYYWREPMDEDFNHCFKVYPESVSIFDIDSETIPLYLRKKLKLKNGHWKIKMTPGLLP